MRARQVAEEFVRALNARDLDTFERRFDRDLGGTSRSPGRE
jgi:hypothetical protein